MEILVVVLIIAAGLGLAFTWASRCSQCRRFLALRFTDSFRDIEKLGVKVRQREALCKYCGHRTWRDHNESDSSPN